MVGRCKVDILQPGVMNIPDIPISTILQLGGLPVAPLSLVILLKLQAWEDHRHATAQYLIDKQHTDVSDLRSLLPLASGMSVKPKKEDWLPNAFVTKAERRVLKSVFLISMSSFYYNKIWQIYRLHTGFSKRLEKARL